MFHYGVPYTLLLRCLLRQIRGDYCVFRDRGANMSIYILNIHSLNACKTENLLQFCKFSAENCNQAQGIESYKCSSH